MEERERSEEECPKELRIAYAKSDFAGRVNMQSGITVRSEPLRLTVEEVRLSKDEANGLAAKVLRAKADMLMDDRRADAMRALDEVAAGLLGRTRV